jgi:hypothetical protein
VAEPSAPALGDFLGRGVADQIGLDGEQVVRLILLTRTRDERFQRLTVAKDLDGTGVSVNVLVPGGVTNTPMISADAALPLEQAAEIAAMPITPNRS